MMNKDLQFFLSHAFYFLAHREIIIENPEMFMAQVPQRIQGLDHQPFLGTYLDWWTTFEKSIVINREKNICLIYAFAGNPMTGGNYCSMVDADGNTSPTRVDYFIGCLQSFGASSCRTNKPMQGQVEAWTLQQTYQRLVEMTGDINNTLPENLLHKIYQDHIDSLKLRIKELYQRNFELSDEVMKTKLELHFDEIYPICLAYQRLEKNTESKLAAIQRARRALKRKLKDGSISNIDYQKVWGKWRKKKELLQYTLRKFGMDELKEMFPDKPHISFEDIKNNFLTILHVKECSARKEPTQDF